MYLFLFVYVAGEQRASEQARAGCVCLIADPGGGWKKRDFFMHEGAHFSLRRGGVHNAPK
jgi:hypothetical protein